MERPHFWLHESMGEEKMNSYLDALVIFTAVPATGGIAGPFGAHFGVCSAEEEYRGGPTSKNIESRDRIGGAPEADADWIHSPSLSRRRPTQPSKCEDVTTSDPRVGEGRTQFYCTGNLAVMLTVLLSLDSMSHLLPQFQPPTTPPRKQDP